MKGPRLTFQFLISFLTLVILISIFISGCKENVSGPQLNNCTYTISGTSFSIPASGTTGTIQVMAGSACMWTAVSNVPWVEIVSGQTGTGNGTVTYQVPTNAGVSRTGSLTIAGQIVNLIQEQKGCVYTLALDEISFHSDGGTGTVRVQTSSGCKWNAKASVNWIRILSGAQGAGNGTIRFEVLNNTGSFRSGAIAIADKRFEIEQSGRCIYDIRPAQQNFNEKENRGQVRVRTSSECTWTAKPTVDWIRILYGSKGKGDGNIGFELTPNSGATRLGSIVIADKAFEIEQFGKTFSISGNVGAEGVEILFLGAANAPASVFSDKTGKFTQSGFPNGEYNIRPSSPCYDFAPRVTRVAVSNRSVENINFLASKNLKADAGENYWGWSETPYTFSGIKSVSKNPIQTYIWDFGDGEVKSCDCPTVEHSYSEDISPCPGYQCTHYFPLTLTIIDIYGCKDKSAIEEVEIIFGY